jgi:hypothetical protein
VSASLRGALTPLRMTEAAELGARTADSPLTFFPWVRDGMTGFVLGDRGGTTEQAAEKVVNTAKGDPQALKRTLIFSDLTARLKVVPFPKPAQLEFSATCEVVPFPFPVACGSRRLSACGIVQFPGALPVAVFLRK